MEVTSKKAIVFKNISWLVVAEVVFKSLGFVFFLIFTRDLGQTVLGFYTYVFSFLSIVNLFWDLGINSYYARKWVVDTADYTEDVKIILSTRIVLVITSLLFLVPYLYWNERVIRIEFILAILIFVIDLFKALPPLYFQARNRFDQVFYINILDRGFGYLGGIAAILMGFNLKAVLFAMLVGKVMAFIYGNLLRPSFVLSKKLPWNTMKKVVLASLPLFLIGLFGSLYFRIDSLMIKYFLGFDQLGFYSAAYRLIETGNVISSIVTSGLFPVLIAVQSGLNNTLQALLSKNLKYLVVVAGFIAMCGILRADDVVVFLYGESFGASADILVYLAPTIIFLFVNGLLLIQMLAQHMEKYVLKVLLVLAAVNISMNWYLIPTYGILGAAMSTIFCEFINTVLLYRKLPVRVSYGWVLYWLPAMALSGIMLYYLPWHWIPTVLVSGVAYFGALALVRVLDVKDLPFSFKRL